MYNGFPTHAKQDTLYENDTGLDQKRIDVCKQELIIHRLIHLLIIATNKL